MGLKLNIQAPGMCRTTCGRAGPRPRMAGARKHRTLCGLWPPANCQVCIHVEQLEDTAKVAPRAAPYSIANTLTFTLKYLHGMRAIDEKFVHDSLKFFWFLYMLFSL